MTVPRSIQWAALAAVALTVPAVASAQKTSFTHVASIFADAKEGPLRKPEGVACTEDGEVVVADTGNGRLLRYQYRQGVVSGGSEVKLAQLTHPLLVEFDPKGNVLALDAKTRRIVKVDPKDAFVETVDIKGAPSPAATPVSFKVDGQGNLYVLDVASDRVLVADPSGKFTRQVTLPKGPGQFVDVGVDAAGVLYALDAVEASVWVASTKDSAFKPLTKRMKDRMNFPAHLTVRKGQLFLVDRNGNGVDIVGLDGTYQGRHLGIGWSDGSVNYPSQLCFDGQGVAFIADRFNNRVQAFSTVQ
jgi:sugar lactone lactonase YvrE